MLPVGPYPGELICGAGVWSDVPSQDYLPSPPYCTHTVPFSWKVPADYTCHLEKTKFRFAYWEQQRAYWVNKRLFVQALRPTTWSCESFQCVIIDCLLERDIPKVVIVHRNYLRALLLGTRNPRCRDGDIYSNPGHGPDFLAWMNRQPAGDITRDWQLNPLGIEGDINANLESTFSQRSH